VQHRFDAIVLAGYDPDRPHPLAHDQGEPHKALIQVAGRPMIAYVIQALAQSARIERIVVVGLDAHTGLDELAQAADCDLHYLPNRSSLFANAVQGFQFLGRVQDPQRHVLLLSADVPLLTGGMVATFLHACRPYDHDAYWGIVERRVMEAAFPGSRRSYLRLVEGQFCNGELYLARIDAALRQQSALQELVELRKNIPRQVSKLGFGVLLRFLLRRLRLADLLGVADRMLGISAVPVILPFAESGMDVDKPHQLDLVEAYLRRQAADGASGARSVHA
jgi:CTP:molybdopterin cytidylyltransferase MocA